MRILLIEDDRDLNETIKYCLEEEGYTVDACLDGEEADFYLEQHIADVILLDRMLPGISGTGLLRRLRAMGDATPVLILTALGTLNDRIEGLDLGADDYLVKPFAMEELMARIRSITRRGSSVVLPQADCLSFKDLSYLENIRELTGPAGTCTLSQREGCLLAVFLRRPNQTISRSQLLTKVWGPAGEVEDGNLDNYIFFLRKRLKSLSSQTAITTIRGVGYRMTSED